MQLSPTELNDLARFFARRISISLEEVTDTPTPAQIRQREAAWSMHLEDAMDAGTLSALALKIERKHGKDPRMQEICGLLRDTGPQANAALGLAILSGAAAVLLVAGLGTAIGLASLLVSGQEAVTVAVSSSVTAEPGDPIQPDPEVLAFARALAATGETSGTSARPVRTEEPAVHEGRCSRPGGGLVGYWYAGVSDPGSAGGTLHVDGARNVRVDYPDRHNGYDARAPVRCVLQPGDRIQLSRDPILVPGNRYWVPLYSGDLVPGQG